MIVCLASDSSRAKSAAAVFAHRFRLLAGNKICPEAAAEDHLGDPVAGFEIQGAVRVLLCIKIDDLSGQLRQAGVDRVEQICVCS